MYKHKQQTPSAFRFKRFCRAKWAAYSSMHREVTIGRVATRVADSSLRKSAAAVALGLVMAQGTLMAQSDLDRETRTLPAVQVAVACLARPSLWQCSLLPISNNLLSVP